MTGSEHGAIYEMVREAKEAPFLTNQFWDSHCDAPLCTNLRNLSSYEKILPNMVKVLKKMVFFAYLCIFMVEWLVTHVETLSVHICYFAPLKNSFLGTCSCSALCLFSKTLTRSIFFARHTHTHCHFSSKFEMK